MFRVKKLPALPSLSVSFGWNNGCWGIIILFVYGSDPNFKKGSATFLYTTEELQQKAVKETKRGNFFKIMRFLGLILSILGVIFSFVVFIIEPN